MATVKHQLPLLCVLRGPKVFTCSERHLPWGHPGRDTGPFLCKLGLLARTRQAHLNLWISSGSLLLGDGPNTSELGLFLP